MFGLGRKKVLVIDDDASLQRQVRVHLETREKLDVIQAMDGESGLERSVGDEPDLIILDWMLPDIQGPEVLARLKTGDSTKNIPVLMLTGRDKVGNIEDAFALGADGYLTKPFSLQKLREKIRDLLNS